MSELRDQHKAFAEWFLQQNPVAPNAEDLAWAAWKAALAQPETTAEPVAWLNRHHAAMVTQDHATAVAMGFTTPLYAHPPRDEWRPASEVPDSDRVVLLWSTEFDKTGSLEVGWYGKPDGSDEAPCWWASHGLPQDPRDILFWRDVQPPTEGA